MQMGMNMSLEKVCEFSFLFLVFIFLKLIMGKGKGSRSVPLSKHIIHLNLGEMLGAKLRNDTMQSFPKELHPTPPLTNECKCTITNPGK